MYGTMKSNNCVTSIPCIKTRAQTKNKDGDNNKTPFKHGFFIE